MPSPYGHQCAVAAFPGADLDGLPVSASPVVATLTLAIDPRHWHQSRSAFDALGRQGPDAVTAAPAIAGWIVLSADRAVTLEEQHTVHDGLSVLADLRTRPDAADRVARLLDDVFQPWLLSRLAPPLRIWHRGAATYLRAGHGDPAAVVAAVHRFLAVLAETPDDAGDGWAPYTRAELVRVVGDVGAKLDRPRPGPSAAVAQLLAMATDEDAAVRTAALEGLAALAAGGHDLDGDRLAALARACADSAYPHERAAARRLLAAFS
jgi:hypothetical protein